MPHARPLAIAIAVALFSGIATFVTPGPAVAGGGCHAPATRGSGDTVVMKDMCITPTVLDVDPGTTITILNGDPTAHNVTASSIFAGLDRQGDAVRFRLDEPGVYPFACTLHAGMVGAVVVGDGSGEGGDIALGAAIAGRGAFSPEDGDAEAGSPTRDGALADTVASASGAETPASASPIRSERSTRPARSGDIPPLAALVGSAMVAAVGFGVGRRSRRWVAAPVSGPG